MKLYQIYNCHNTCLMSDYIYQEAKTATEAIFKKFNVKTKRNASNEIDFLVTPVEPAGDNRYYKRGNRVGYSIFQ